MDRWAERFSIEAHERIMGLLKGEVNAEIGGLVEVAIQACSATGHTPFAEALRDLGRTVRLERNAFVLVFEEILANLPPLLTQLIDWLKGLLGIPQSQPKPVEEQAEQFVASLLAEMPDAIRANITRAEPREMWAQRVITHLIETLETLVRVARIEHAEKLMLETA